MSVLQGDIRDSGTVGDLLSGCDALIHAAGIVGTDRRREQLMWEINAHATEAVLNRAVEAGLDPIVSVSSYSSLFPPPNGVISADTPPAPGRSPYAQTKAYADRAARRLQDAGAPVVVTYPSSVVGPAYFTAAGVTERGWAPIAKAGLAPRMTGGMQMIDVRDVALVHERLMVPGRGPKRYVCGGVMVSFNEMIDVLEQGTRTQDPPNPFAGQPFPGHRLVLGSARRACFRSVTGSATRPRCCSPPPPPPTTGARWPIWASRHGVRRRTRCSPHSAGDTPRAWLSSRTSRCCSSGESSSVATVVVNSAAPAAIDSTAFASDSDP